MGGYGAALAGPAYGRALGGGFGASPISLGGGLGPLGVPALGAYGRAPSTYQFGYGVQTADYTGAANFGHNEERNALGTVGQYHVNTPNSFQYVNYNVPSTHGLASPIPAYG